MKKVTFSAHNSQRWFLSCIQKFKASW